jgi:hypothetical protein
MFTTVYPAASAAYFKFCGLILELEMLLEDSNGVIRPQFSFLVTHPGELYIDISGFRSPFVTRKHIQKIALRSVECLVPLMAEILDVADSLITYVNEIVAQYVLVIKDIKARA